jgi:protein involved in polysaccharide export with SLBB domain
MKVKVLFILVLSGCLFQSAFGQETPLRGYLLGPGDVVEGKALGEKEDFQFIATVDEDGKIQVPYSAEGVVATCKTEKDLLVEITKIWSRLLKTPQVSFRVTQRNRPPIAVYGEIRTPQKIELSRQVRLLEILSFSGGPTEKAGGMVQVVHTLPPMCTEKNNAAAGSAFDAPKLYSLSSLRNGTEETNPIVQPGDLVVVLKAPPVYVIGEVNILKEIYITENGLTLTEALAQAGGFNREAQKKDIVIQRLKSGSKERETIKVNFELMVKGKTSQIMLQPEDIVVVNKTKKSIGETILEVITGGAKNALNILPTVIL